MSALRSWLASATASADTNILVYAALEQGQKTAPAREVLQALSIRDAPIALQCLGEFYHVVTRKYGFDGRQARLAIARWRDAFVVRAAGVETLDRAMHAAERHHLNFWDALLIATLREQGVGVLFSEDMQNGQVIDGVRIVNPFVK